MNAQFSRRRDEELFRILREVEKGTSQRAIARTLSFSLGKVNYLVNALVEKGFVKIANFRKNPDKLAYCCILTRKGLREKYRLTAVFLQRKEDEYMRISREILDLRRELSGVPSGKSPELQRQPEA